MGVYTVVLAQVSGVRMAEWLVVESRPSTLLQLPCSKLQPDGAATSQRPPVGAHPRTARSGRDRARGLKNTVQWGARSHDPNHGLRGLKG
jgi:hypothetical protein